MGKHTASTSHLSTCSCTILAIRSVSHHTFGLSWRSGWSRALQRVSSIPKALQDPASSFLLRSPIP